MFSLSSRRLNRCNSIFLVCAFPFLIFLFFVQENFPINDQEDGDSRSVSIPSRVVSEEDYDYQQHAALEDNTKDEDEQNLTLTYHEIWLDADSAINRHSLFTNTTDVNRILWALSTAKIVYVDRFREGLTRDRGASEKWVVTLEGGQRAMMKLDWKPEEFGKMKPHGRCNDGFERPSSEIAAFHLYKVLGIRNCAYSAGRVVDIKKDIIPVATPNVLKYIYYKDNKLCLTGNYYHYNYTKEDVCPNGGKMRASLSYWLPRDIKGYHQREPYMPFCTVNKERFGKTLNNRTYCNAVRKEFELYDKDEYYYDLFDFAVMDSLMYHYDTKQYVIHDSSPAKGLSVHIDQGRTFCSMTEKITFFLAPINQCCTLRKSTYEKLKYFSERRGKLSSLWKQSMTIDLLNPIMVDDWYPVIEHRLTSIINTIENCAKENGGIQNVLVE